VPTPLEEQLKLCPYVLNVMVHGDNRPYNVALVVANLPAVRKWADEQQLSLPSDPDAILKDDRVRSLFRREIEKYGSMFKGFESIQDFALLREDFTTDNGMLTPSLKLKRRKVVEVYGSTIEQLYASRALRAKSTATAAAS
jgi:long-chain acyl-CoA synthetase